MTAFRASDDGTVEGDLDQDDDVTEEIQIAPGVTRVRRVRTGPRPKVWAQKDLRRIVSEDRKGAPAVKPQDERPKVRGDCAGGARPCPWAGCKYHLALSVNPNSGAVTLNFPGREVWELEETCALDVAERGGTTLDVVGQLTNVTRERVRQVEVKALMMLRLHPRTPK